MAWMGALLLGSAVRAPAQVSLSVAFVPRKEAKESSAPDPSRLSDIVRIKADTDSSAGIARIVIEVDDLFRAEIKKPPFLYDWDTLDENEGLHTLAVTAYDTDGRTAVKRLKVTVENRLDLGVKHYVARALEAFQQGDALQLDIAARKAFKINAADPEAIRVMALDVGIKGDVSRAFQLLDNPQNKVPKNDPITEEIRGFLLLMRGASATDVAAMLPDLQAGLVQARKRVHDVQEAAEAAHPENQSDYAGQIVRGDALFAADAFTAALSAYQRAVELAHADKEKRRAHLRAGIALLRLGRLHEAELLATRLTNGSAADATSSALMGATLFQKRKYVEASAAVQAGAQRLNVAALVVAALADLANGTRARAYKEARDAVETADTAETQYVAQAALADVGDQTGARKSFQIALLRAPLFLPTLVERAYELMAYDKADNRFVQGMQILNTAISYEPDNTAALAGRIVALLYLKRYRTAQPLLARLAIADPFAPDVYVMKSFLYDRDPAQARAYKDALDYSHTLDPVNFNDGQLPLLPDLVMRMIRLRRTVPLTPALLDRADAPPPSSHLAATGAPAHDSLAPADSPGKR